MATAPPYPPRDIADSVAASYGTSNGTASTDAVALVRLGVFAGHPVELIAGQLVVAEPQGSYHATAVGAVDARSGPSFHRASSCEPRCR
jgi:hypothetical protein